MRISRDAIVYTVDVVLAEKPTPAVKACQQLIDTLKTNNRELHDKLDQALGLVLLEAQEAGIEAGWNLAQDPPAWLFE